MLASRRTILALGGSGAVALLAGCSADSIPIIGPPDPDDELRRGVAASERELIAAYDAAIAAAGRSAGLLRTLRQQHVDHLTAVTQDLDDAGPPAAPPTAAVTPAALRRLEAAATRQRIDACAAAGDAELAELLARIAASESGHVAALSNRARA